MNAVPELSIFNLLAGAVAGRKTSVYAASEAERFAYCDRQAIFIPNRLSADHLEARNAVLGQALLLSSRSLDAALVRNLVGRPAAARRYAWLEILRAIDGRRAELPLVFLRHPALSARIASTRSARESLSLALDKAAAIGEIPEFIGSVRPLAVLRSVMASEGIAALMGRPARESSSAQPPSAADDDAETEAGPALNLLESTSAGSSAVSDWLKRIMGMRRGAQSREESASDAGGGGEAPVVRAERARRRGVLGVVGRSTAQIPELDYRRQPAQYSYPEWDEAHQRYLKEWVQVTEADPQNLNGPSDVSAVLAPPNREFLRQLSGLGLDFEMNRAQRDGSDLDMGRLIERAIEMRVGASELTDDVYRASRRTRRDLDVVVLADTSGSTQEFNAAGESLFRQHLRSAYQLARTFDRLGDRVALYGFQSWGRRVHFARLKDHEEVWGQVVAERLAQVEPIGFTRTGAAIRHANRLLRNSVRLPNRLLVLITDGFSYDQDYEERHAEADVRMALSEAHATGTACVVLCIGGAQSKDKLASVFGQSNLLMVDDGRQIPSRIRRICARALAAVSHRALCAQ